MKISGSVLAPVCKNVRLFLAEVYYLPWQVAYCEEFAVEFAEFIEGLQNELLAHQMMLAALGSGLDELRLTRYTAVRKKVATWREKYLTLRWLPLAKKRVSFWLEYKGQQSPESQLRFVWQRELRPSYAHRMEMVELPEP